MSELRERASYLEGLVRGIDLSDSDAQSRVWHGIISLLGDMAREVDDLQHSHNRLESYLGDMDEDLMDLEDSVLGEVDAQYMCAACGRPILPDDTETLELTCPECGETTWDPDEELGMAADGRQEADRVTSPGDDRMR